MGDIQIVAKYQLLLLVLVSGLLVPNTQAITKYEVEASMWEAYRLVVDAENSGGDVSVLISNLNVAAFFLKIGDTDSLTRAMSIIDEVRNTAGVVGSAGAQSVLFQYITVGGMLALLGITGILVYLYGSRLFWMFWLRSKKGWKAKAAD